MSSSNRSRTATPPIHVTEPSETSSMEEKCTVSLSPGYASYSETLLLPLPTEYDSASHDDLSADETYELQPSSSPPLKEKTSNWRKVKNVVQWTPFIQTYKRHKYPWVQLAGHQGNFKAGEKQGTILKKLCPAEQRALEGLMKDVLRPYVPEYMGLVESGDQEQYLQLQDLLSDFTAPCVMDIKMGVRTYLEEELAKAREKPKLRKDMYEKMIQIDPLAPSEAEQRAQAVTKPRYMVWRETISSTATLGFRIEGVKKSDGTSSKDFKTTRTQEQVLSALAAFVNGYDHAPGEYLKRLKEIRTTLESSKFFMSHELIGSSLLFVHNEKSAEVWLIDFAKSIPLPGNVSITHRAPWVEGSHEDGYLLGLDNLIKLMAALELQHQQRKQDPAQQKTSGLKGEEKEGNTVPSVSSEIRKQEGTSDSKTSSKTDGISPCDAHPPSEIEQQPNRPQQNASATMGTSRNIASSVSNSISDESKDPKLNDSSVTTPFRGTNDTDSNDSRQASQKPSQLYMNSTTPNTKPQVGSDSRKVLESSSGESHSPTDIRNMIKSSTEMNSIS